MWGKRVISAACALVVCAAMFSAFVAVTNAQSDGEEAVAGGPENQPTADPPPLEFPPRYAADEGAQSWEDLSADERAASDRIAEWAEADHGAAVHQRWRKASREGARISKLRHAAYLSGLRGLEGLGVEP